MHWISTNEQLPPAGKYVFARHKRATWIDRDDQENVNVVVVKRVEGISLAEREKINDERAKIYRSEDESHNNRKPYNWQAFGPDSFFGQEITHWMAIPPLN